jgi:chromate transporter
MDRLLALFEAAMEFLQQFPLFGLVAVFVPLSLLSFGGGQAIIADIQYQTVTVHNFLSNREFTDMYAISRAAPGPSTLIAALIGWQVQGLWGAIVATLAIYIPSSIVVYRATHWWHNNPNSPWRKALAKGLAPIAVGLIFAGIVAVLRSARILDFTEVNWLGLATFLVSGLLLYFTKVSPYVLIGVVALLYGGLELAGLN